MDRLCKRVRGPAEVVLRIVPYGAFSDPTDGALPRLVYLTNFHQQVDQLPAPDPLCATNPFSVPFYFTVTKEARRFTTSLFSGRLKIEVREVDPVSTGNWELTSLAKLSRPNGEVVSELVHGSRAVAIVGATLKALTMAPGLLTIDVEIVQ